MASDTTTYEVKVYIQDDNGRWVDFSDRIESSGKNKLKDIGNITYSSESKSVGGVFLSSIDTIQFDNSDGFWDDPSQWSSLKTTDGNTASFSTSSSNNENRLEKKKVRVSIHALMTDGTINEYNIGIFRVLEISTDSKSGIASMKVESQSSSLSKLDAEKVRDGKSWYSNRSIVFLIRKLLEQEYGTPLPSSFKFPDRVDIETYDNSREVSSYGRPPEWNGSSWLSKGLTCRVMEWAELTNTSPNAQGSKKRLYFGCDAELWEWDPNTDTYTQIDDGSSFGSNYKIVYMTSFITEPGARTNLYVILADPSYRRDNQTMYIYKYDGGAITYNPFGNGVSATFSAHLFNHIIRRGYWAGDADSWGSGSGVSASLTWVGRNYGDGSYPRYAGENVSVPFDQKIESLSSANQIDYLSFEPVSDISANGTYPSAQSNRNTSKGYYVCRSHLIDYEIIDVGGTFGGDVTIEIYSIDDELMYTYNLNGGTETKTSGVSLNRLKAIKVKISWTGATPPTITNWYIEGSVFGTIYLTNLAIPTSNDHYIDSSGNLFIDYSLTTRYIYMSSSLPNNTYSEIDLAMSYGQWSSLLYFPENDKLIRWTLSLSEGQEYPDCNVYVSYGSGGSVVSDTLTNNFVYASNSTTAFGLYPTAMCRVESSYSTDDHPKYQTDFYVASITPTCKGNSSMSSFIHLFRNSKNGLKSVLTNGSSDVGDNKIRVLSINAAYFQAGDLIRVGTKYYSIYSVDKPNGYLYVYPTISIQINTKESVYLMAKLVYSGFTEKYVITEMVDAGGTNRKLIINAVDRDNINSNLSVIGELSITDKVQDITATSYLFGSSGTNIYSRYTSLYRGLPARSYGRTLFVTTTDGLLWKVDTTNKQLVYSASLDEVESNQSARLLIVPSSDMTDMDGLSRTQDVVFGISAPTFPEETQYQKPTGKYYLWKYDKWLTDRVELADFTDMNVWQAISSLVNIAPDYMAGFNLDDEGSFFLAKKTDSSYTSITINADGTDDNLISISKNRGLSEVYNRASIVPYMAKMQDPSFEVVLAPRDETNREEKDSAAKSDDIKLSVGVDYEVMTKLICVRDGDVNAAYTDMDSCPLFKYSVFERTIDAVLTADYTAGYNYFIVDSTFRGGTPTVKDDGVTNWILPDAINVGDYVTFVNPDTQAESTVKITSIDVDNNVITIAESVSFNVKARTVVTITHNLNLGDNTSTSTWSSDGVAKTSGSGTNTTTVAVSSVRDLSKHTVVKIGDTYSRITSIDDYNEALSSPSITLTTAVSYSDGDTIYAYWAPSLSSDGSTYEYQEIGGTGIYMSISPSNDNQIKFKQFDRITIVSKGLKLEKAEHSKQIAYDSTSEGKYGTLEFSDPNNRFIRRAIAKHYVKKIVRDYKDPHYVLTINTSLLPNANFTDSNGLMRFILYSKKMFPKKLKVVAYPRKITHNFKRGTTTIIARDEDKY